MNHDQPQWRLIVPFGGHYYVIGNPLRRITDLLRRLREKLRRKPEPPGYPYADKFAPVKPRPKGRSGAAVVEFDDEPPRR